MINNLRNFYWKILGFLINRVSNGCQKGVKENCYYKALKKYSEQISKNYADVSNIFAIGGCNNPGISDIDVLIVLDDDAKIKEASRLCNIERYSSYVTHGPFITANSLFREFRSYNTYKLEPLFVRDQKENPLSTEAGNHKSQYYLHIVLSSLYIIHFLKNIDFNKKIEIKYVRYNLLRLKSVSHTASCMLFLNILEDEKEMLKEYIDEVDSMRNLWFSNSKENNKSQIIFLEEKSKNILYKCGEIVDRSLNDLICVETKQDFEIDGLSFSDNATVSNKIPKNLVGIAKFISVTSEKGERDWLDLPVIIKFKCESFRIYLEEYSMWINKQYNLYDSNGFYACAANPPYISSFFKKPVFDGDKAKMNRNIYLKKALFLTLNRFLKK